MNPLLLLASAPNTAREPGIWLPEAASTFTHDVDPVWDFLFWTSVFFTVLIIGILVVFVIKYRMKDRNDRGRGPSHSTVLEVGWTLPPLVLVLLFFAFGFRGYVNMSEIPDEGSSLQVVVESWKWGWNFQYVTESGVVNSPILYVPNDRPIRLILQSQDVIHSFYVPAFRIKKDCVPGRFNKTWFRATKNGEYDLFCTEYCGAKHSAMISKAVVMDLGDFHAKLEELNNPFLTPPIELGQKIYEQQCLSCHSIDGSPNIGPTWKNLYRAEGQVLVGGQMQDVVKDEEYLRESIDYPMAKLVPGYQPVMQSYQGRFKEAEYLGLYEYMKKVSLKTADNPEGTYEGPIMEVWPEGSGSGEAGEAGAEPAAAPGAESAD